MEDTGNDDDDDVDDDDGDDGDDGESMPVCARTVSLTLYEEQFIGFLSSSITAA